MRQTVGYEDKKWDFLDEREYLSPEVPIRPLGGIDSPTDPVAVRGRVVDVYRHGGVPHCVRLGGETGSLSIYTDDIHQFEDHIDDWCVMNAVMAEDDRLTLHETNQIRWIGVNQRPAIETLVSKGRRRPERQAVTREEVIEGLETRAEVIEEEIEARLPDARGGTAKVRRSRLGRDRRTYYIRIGFNGVLVPEEVETAARAVEAAGEVVSHTRGATPILETRPVRAVPWEGK